VAAEAARAALKEQQQRPELLKKHFIRKSLQFCGFFVGDLGIIRLW
jgi:hypothetical protein